MRSRTLPSGRTTSSANSRARANHTRASALSSSDAPAGVQAIMAASETLVPWRAQPGSRQWSALEVLQAGRPLTRAQCLTAPGRGVVEVSHLHLEVESCFFPGD